MSLARLPCPYAHGKKHPMEREISRLTADKQTRWWLPEETDFRPRLQSQGYIMANGTAEMHGPERPRSSSTEWTFGWMLRGIFDDVLPDLYRCIACKSRLVGLLPGETWEVTTIPQGQDRPQPSQVQVPLGKQHKTRRKVKWRGS